MCYNCYKAHLLLLQSNNSISTDSDIAQTISTLSHQFPKLQEIITTEDIANAAMIKTTIDVGKKLLNREALLLPMINDIFNSHACHIIRIKQKEDSVNAKELVTSRWILLQLTVNLKQHIASTCKVRKYGTLIYRPNTDLLSVISQLLWKIRGLEINKSDDNIPENTCKFKDNSDQVLDNLNKRIHSSIKTLLATDAKTPGTLADTSLKEKTYEIGFLAFIRLIGTIYFKKHATGFETSSPEAHFYKFITHSQTIKEQHLNWLNDIRQNIWDRIKFENEMIPSSDALYLHWKRSCWISHMWQQADKNIMVLEDMTNYGWRLDDGNLKVVWDTDENIQSIRNRVEILLQGCKCKTGRTTARCSCKKNKETCREGCQCMNCENTENLPNGSNISEAQYIEWEELYNNGLDDDDFDELADFILNDDIYEDNENVTDDEA